MEARLAKVLVASALFVGVASACASVLGIDPLEFPAADGGVAPPIDKAACLARTADAATAIFVRSDGADGATCGAIAAPCRTVGFALGRARAEGKPRVLVADGTYVENLTIDASVSVEGAWITGPSSWSPACTETASAGVTILGATPGTPTVGIGETAGQVQIAFLTVRAPDAITPGQSVFAVSARGEATRLVLQDAILATGKAGDGQPGVDGVPGTTATDACDAGTGQSNPNPPTNGDTANGVFSPDGYTPGTAGQGSDGGPGEPGSTLTEPSCVVCITCSGTCGTGANCGPLTNLKSCGTPGVSGCGGGGGSGGTGGSGGGSSVALFLWGARADIRGGALRAGAGGRGGNGGSGGNAGSGAPGATGDAGEICNTSDFCSCDLNSCNSHAGAGNKGAGTAGVGGAGGRGANGGQGGGGAGGASFAIYRGVGSSVDLSRSPALDTAGPAPGGEPNGPAGNSSRQGP